MSHQGFEIRVTQDAVDVRRNVSFLIQRYGRYIGFAYIAAAILLFYWTVLDSHGRISTWDLVIHHRSAESDFSDAVICLVIGLVLLGVISGIGARTFFPSGELLHCDRSTFTVSRIPWYNLRGSWTTRSYALGAISELRYARIYSNRSGRDFDGLRFSAAGKEQKLFPGLGIFDAHKILKGLHALGVDVPHDSDFHELVEHALQEHGFDDSI